MMCDVQRATVVRAAGRAGALVSGVNEQCTTRSGIDYYEQRVAGSSACANK